MHGEFLAASSAVFLSWAYLVNTGFSILLDHDALRRFLSVAETTGKLTRYRLEPSELDFDVVHHVEIKCFVSDMTMSLKTEDENLTPLDDDVPIHTIFSESLTITQSTVKPELEINDKLKGFSPSYL